MDSTAKSHNTTKKPLTWTQPHTIPRPPGRKRASESVPRTMPATHSHSSESPRRRERTQSPRLQHFRLQSAHSDPGPAAGTPPLTQAAIPWTTDMLPVSFDSSSSTPALQSQVPSDTPELYPLNNALLAASGLQLLDPCAQSGAFFSNTSLDPGIPDAQMDIDTVSGTGTWTADEDPAMVRGLGLSSGPCMRGYNALHIASRRGQATIVRMLLATKSPLDVDSLTADGQSALHIAASSQHIDVSQELLGAGANAMLRDADGQTAMHKAARTGSMAVAREIADKCSECLHVRDNAMQTPLHQAVMYGHEEMVKFLLDEGANPAAIIL